MLFRSENFGLDRTRLTKSSDCYALGMVIYETISGNVPFHEYMEMVVFARVILGEHPSRCAAFPEDVWKTMGSCWTFQPRDRPGIADILRCLRAASNSSKFPAPRNNGEMEADSDNQCPLDHSPDSDTIMAGRSTPMPAFTHATDRGPGPAQSLRGAFAAEATGERNVDIPEGTDPNIAISPVNSTKGGARQVGAM